MFEEGMRIPDPVTRLNDLVRRGTNAFRPEENKNDEPIFKWNDESHKKVCDKVEKVMNIEKTLLDNKEYDHYVRNILCDLKSRLESDYNCDGFTFSRGNRDNVEYDINLKTDSSASYNHLRVAKYIDLVLKNILPVTFKIEVGSGFNNYVEDIMSSHWHLRKHS